MYIVAFYIHFIICREKPRSNFHEVKKGSPDRRVPLRGTGAPKVVSAVGVVEAELGARAELHCEASGVPLPNPMEWSFNGKQTGKRGVWYFALIN